MTINELAKENNIVISCNMRYNNGKVEQKYWVNTSPIELEEFYNLESFQELNLTKEEFLSKLFEEMFQQYREEG